MSSPHPAVTEPHDAAPTSSGAPVEQAVHVAEGLQGVIATQTRLSHVQGAIGRLTIAGFEIGDIAPNVPFEALAHLLLHDRLPSAEELQSFRSAIAQERGIRPSIEVLRSAARTRTAPIDALRLGVASLAGHEVTPQRLFGALPSLLAAYRRMLVRQEPLELSPELSCSESFLWAFSGSPASPEQCRALDTYWNTVADHGLNASTFTARVIASTQSDLGSAVEGALGALKGALHGGAPGPALDAFLRLRAEGGDLAAHTRIWAEDEVAAGRRLMGFGHRIYRVRDPRADVLERAARSLLGGSDLLADARIHERAVLAVLERLKPGRGIATNVEFYTALLLHGLGFEADWFTAVFALGRLAGWIAHVAEQRARGRLIRPEALYVGAEGRRFSAG